MGLSICYELRLPPETSEEYVLGVLERLREHARALTPHRISSMYSLSTDELEQEPEPDWSSLDWFFRVSGKGMLYDYENALTYVRGRGDQTAVIGFAVHPGERCEAASFGFLRPQARDVPRPDDALPDWGWWSWHACCKTQYASVISDEHLIHCHLMLVELLEECQRLGVDVVVRDETGYWETRSTEQLLVEVDKMNRIVARFAGALHDAISGQHSVQGSIFEHPDFERLETPPGGAT